MYRNTVSHSWGNENKTELQVGRVERMEKDILISKRKSRNVEEGRASSRPRRTWGEVLMEDLRTESQVRRDAVNVQPVGHPLGKHE